MAGPSSSFPWWRQHHLAAWRHEHLYPTLTGMASAEPSVSVLKLLAFAAQHDLVLGPQILDVGCGKGRNALFLAQQGYQISAFDLIDEALDILKERACQAGLTIDVRLAAMDAPWPYSDATFDVLIDDTASMSIGYSEGVVLCRSEMARVLRPGGYALLYSLAEDDPWFQRLSPEKHIVVTPDGKREVLFPLQELRSIPGFRCIHQECWAHAGTTHQRKTVWTLLQKQEMVPQSKILLFGHHLPWQDPQQTDVARMAAGI